MDSETERFLRDFKKLEDRLVVLSHLEDNFVSFSRALDKVHFNKLNPVVSSEEAYQFLKTASDLRNILSHEDGVCVPSKAFVDEFESYVNEITDPLTALDICTKAEQLVVAGLHTELSWLASQMAQKHLSHVPVIVDGTVQGVFSSTTFFQYFYENGHLQADEDSTVADFLQTINTSGHLNEEFIFVSQTTPAYALIRYFSKKEAGAKRISVIFLTPKGGKDERLVGLITEADLLKLPVYERKAGQ